MKSSHKYRLTDGTGHWVARLYRAMRSDFDVELKKKGVAVTEYALLAAVFRGDASTPSEVATVTGLDRAVATRALERAVQNGLATRGEGKDRRSLSIQLTAKGSKIAKDLLRASKRINDVFFADFTAKEEQKIREFIDRAIASRAESKHHVGRQRRAQKTQT